MKHLGPIAGIAATKGFIATAGYDNQLILWDAASRQAVARGVHDHLVNNCAFSSDGTMIVSASSDYSARIWSVPSLRLKAALVGHEDDVDMATFSPDDRLVATCALDRAVRIFDLTGRCLNVLKGHTGNIRAVVWTHDGEGLVTTGVDGTVREWDVKSGKELRQTAIDVRTDTLVIDAKGRILAGDDRGRIIVLIDGIPSFTAAHDAGVKKISYDASTGVVVTLSYDRTLAVWQANGERSINLLSRSDIPASVWARAATVVGPHVIGVGTFGARFGLFDWRSNLWDLSGVEAGAALNAVAVVDGERYAVGDAGIVTREGRPITRLGSLCNFLVEGAGRIFAGGQQGALFDATTGETLHQHHSPLNCAATFERDGERFLAVGAYTGEALIFALPRGRRPELVDNLKLYENPIKGLAASETELFSVCASTDIAWHSLHDFKEIRRIAKAHDRIANGCCRAGEDSFASIGRDRKLRLWTGGNEEMFDTPHPNSVKCICASDDRMTLMTGAYTGTVAGFDVKSRSWTSFSRPTASGISSLAFDADQDGFLAGSYDGCIYDIA